MSYGNYATSGATQHNLGFQIHRTYHCHFHIIPIQFTTDGHITARHYHGEGMYDRLKGKILNARDESTTNDTLESSDQYEKYVDNVLSHYGMYDKLENAKARVLRIIKNKAPHVNDHDLFPQPQLPSEETDLVEFVTRLWSARVDGGTIYIRSAKLLSLALLLSEYGCRIDIFIEGDDLEAIPIKVETSGLCVVYSYASIKCKGREYVATDLADGDSLS